MNEGALAPGAGAHVPAGGEPPRLASGRDGLLARLWQNERGTAIVEFALVAPVLFLLVFGIIDFARALNYYNQMSQLVGQGARAAAVDRNPDGTGIGQGGVGGVTCATTESIQCQLVDYYAHAGEFQKGLAVCVVPPTGGTGSPVTVRATFDFKFLPIVGGATLQLSTTQTERFESSAPDYTGGSWTTNGAGGNACP
jgi:Flp pilus assembly protein TadG